MQVEELGVFQHNGHSHYGFKFGESLCHAWENVETKTWQAQINRIDGVEIDYPLIFNADKRESIGCEFIEAVEGHRPLIKQERTNAVI